MTPRRRPALKKARERAGLKQRELAERIGISRAFVIAVEVGRRKPSFDLMERWAKALGRKPSFDLFSLEAGEDGGAGSTKADISEVA
jgi:transcriptional regulator with XRE-family HTH domain